MSRRFRPERDRDPAEADHATRRGPKVGVGPSRGSWNSAGASSVAGVGTLVISLTSWTCPVLAATAL